MAIAEITVSLGGVGAIAFLAWFFFGPKQAQMAQLKEKLPPFYHKLNLLRQSLRQFLLHQVSW
jgi:hypothetical protein